MCSDHSIILPGESSCFENVHVYCMRTLTRYSPKNIHGPTHYKIGITCVYNGHVFYTLF